MSFQVLDNLAFLRDEFVPFPEAQLSIASSPVLYGLAVYSVCMATYDETTDQVYIFRLRDHYKRLKDSAKIMDFTAVEDVLGYDEFEVIMQGLITKNNIKENSLIRMSFFIDELIAGTKTYGLKTSFAAYVYPMGEILPRTGVKLCISSWQRTPDNAIPSRAKINGSYINATLMKNEALHNGYDDAIALDGSGHVAEATVANVFIVRDGRLITPDTATDILEGITRNTILRLAKDLAIPAEQRAIDRSELYIADEGFVCGSSARIIPILSVDKRPLSSLMGTVTKTLADTFYSVLQNQDPRYNHWNVPTYQKTAENGMNT